MAVQMTARLATCPNGHQVKPIPVVYGLPTPQLQAADNIGRVRLGGCDPTFENDRIGDCPTCGAPIPAAIPNRSEGG
jgi:hypothetical protein